MTAARRAHHDGTMTLEDEVGVGGIRIEASLDQVRLALDVGKALSDSLS